MTPEEHYKIQYEEHVYKMHIKDLAFQQFLAHLRRNLEEFPSTWSYAPAKAVDDFEQKMLRELDMQRSMDAPNKPGYYRANND